MKSDTNNPLAFHMPPDGLAVYMSGNPVFEITPNPHNEEYEVVVRDADKDRLQSGRLIGVQTLAKKTAMVAAEYKEGRVILNGLRAQHRAQTHGTYKLLFNALLRWRGRAAPRSATTASLGGEVARGAVEVGRLADGVAGLYVAEGVFETVHQRIQAGAHVIGLRAVAGDADHVVQLIRVRFEIV